MHPDAFGISFPVGTWWCEVVQEAHENIFGIYYMAVSRSPKVGLPILEKLGVRYSDSESAKLGVRMSDSESIWKTRRLKVGLPISEN